MADINAAQLQALVDSSFDQLTDDVFDDALIAQIESGIDPAAFKVTTARLAATSQTAADAMPMNMQLAMFAGSGNMAAFSSNVGGAKALNTAAIVAEADGQKRSAAAEGIRKLICSTLRDWFETNLDKLKKWIEDTGIKGAVKKLAQIGKELLVAAVTAVSGVVGSMALAWFLVGVAIAAVGAAIYFLVKNGLPNYCPAD